MSKLECGICHKMKTRGRYTLSDADQMVDGLHICHRCQKYECVSCGWIVNRSMISLETMTCRKCREFEAGIQLEETTVICQSCKVVEVSCQVWPGDKPPRKTCDTCASNGAPSETGKLELSRYKLPPSVTYKFWHDDATHNEFAEQETLEL